jgi:hypothetical protein
MPKARARLAPERMTDFQLSNYLHSELILFEAQLKGVSDPTGRLARFGRIMAICQEQRLRGEQQRFGF